MTAVYPIQTSFVGGEISPRLAARVDTERYRQSVAKYTNFFSTPQGSAFKRPGSQFFFETNENGPARLVQFSRGREEDFVIEFTDSAIRMFNRDGLVQKAGGEELVNPEFSQGSDGLFGWTTTSFLTQLETILGELVEVTVMEFEALSPRFTVTQLEGAIGEDGSPSNFVNLSQSVEVDEDPLNPGTWLPHTMSTDYLFAGDGNLFTVRILIGDGVTEDAYADVTYSELSTGNGNFPIVFTPLVSTVTIKYEFRLPTTPTTDPNFAVIENLSLKPQVNDPLILSTGVPDAETSVPWTGVELFELDVVMDLGGDANGPDRLWIAHPNHPPHILVRVSRNDWNCYDQLDAATPAAFQIVMPPATWTTDNYPATVEIFAGRSWYSGVPSDRARLWGSKAGDYFDFTTGASPGDALDLNLITRGAIQWIKGQKALLLGTDLAEHTVQSSVSFATLQVGDIDVLEQSANGSVPIEPLIISNEVVYLSPDQTKVFATDYLRTNDGWISWDLTWFAEHITRQGITRHIWARDPDNQLICIMADGNITNCVYDRRRETIGWSTFETQGDYISGCVTNDLSGSSKWYCVKRDGNYYIETVQAGEVNNEYMDSWISKPTVNKVVDGLEHLEGQTVQVLVSGAVEPDKVVESGQITTQGDGQAVVGLQYMATMVTLRTEGGNQAGTSQVSLMDFSEVHLRLNNSAVPRVNGQLPPLRNPQTPMNTPTPLTDDDAITWQLGRENKGQLTIEQDLPLRTEIVAIYGKLRSSTV